MVEPFVGTVCVHSLLQTACIFNAQCVRGLVPFKHRLHLRCVERPVQRIEFLTDRHDVTRNAVEDVCGVSIYAVIKEWLPLQRLPIPILPFAESNTRMYNL